MARQHAVHRRQVLGIARANTGTVQREADPEPARHVGELGIGPSSALARTGSSAMPHFGQAPGRGCRISGCIGQV